MDWNSDKTISFRWRRVALLAESVDWNGFCLSIVLVCFIVALLTESVDWNYYISFNLLKKAYVALLTESVDWNILFLIISASLFPVALLTESVDWNICAIYIDLALNRSLSSRRAWIEIPVQLIIQLTPFLVALLTESVDWNARWDTLHKEGIPPDFDISGFMLFSSVSVAFLPYGVGSLLPYLRG